MLLIGGFNATTNSSLFYKKSLTVQWDQRANDSSVSKEFRGAFSKERILYAVVQESNSKQIVYQYKGSDFVNSVSHYLLKLILAVNLYFKYFKSFII